jgi:methionyl-tRNA formyltransferase
MQRIRKIAIITTAEHSCAQYLAARFLKRDLDVCIFSQVAPKCLPGSWRYLQRLRRRRGILVFADNLLEILADYARFSRMGRFLRRSSKPNAPLIEWPVLDRDLWAGQIDDRFIIRTADVNSSDSYDSIRKFSPDLILLAGAPIVSKHILLLPRYGVLNPHCGITPNYAGCNPTVWPLYDDCPFEIGYTIHFAVPQVDAGPIVEQARLPWRTEWTPSATASYLLHVMYERLALIVEHWVDNGTRPNSQSQPKVKSRPPAGYITSRIAERNRRRLHQQGVKIIVPPDWPGAYRTATDVGRFVFEQTSDEHAIDDLASNTKMSLIN